MRRDYSCPHCQAVLNPDQSIILVAECGGPAVLVGLHPQPGNYEVHLPPGVAVESGSRWTFLCPVCRENLVTGVSPNLCALDVRAEGAAVHRVFFSRIAGEQATFVVTAEGLLEDYGVHTDRYLEELVHKKYLR